MLDAFALRLDSTVLLARVCTYRRFALLCAAAEAVVAARGK